MTGRKTWPVSGEASPAAGRGGGGGGPSDARRRGLTGTSHRLKQHFRLPVIFLLLGVPPKKTPRLGGPWLRIEARRCSPPRTPVPVA